MDTQVRQYSDIYYTLPSTWTTDEHMIALRKWVDVQLRQLDVKPTNNVMEDLATVQYLTKSKLISGAELYMQLIHGSVDLLQVTPFVLPHIRNVLNERDVRITKCTSVNPALSFQGNLYMPQATLLNRILELEEYANTFPAMNDNQLNLIGLFQNLTTNDAPVYVVQSNIGIIKERISFGKTYMMPALFCTQLVPRFRQVNAKCNLGYFCNGEIMPTNIVLCNTKVAKEWINNIATNTNLTHTKVITAKDLDKVHDIDVLPHTIVVKDGDITWNGEKQSALSHFLKIHGDKLFARLIVDDYDMLKFKSDHSLPKSVFTWIISSTDGQKGVTGNSNTYGYYFNSHIQVVGDKLFALMCNADYSAIEFNIPRIEYFEVQDSIDQIILCLTRDEIPKRETVDVTCKNLLTANRDAPYDPTQHKLKIMVVIEDKTERISLIKELTSLGLKAGSLDRRNIHMFAQNDLQVAVCGVMCGVNLGCVSHLIIYHPHSFSDAQLNQIVGRAQRISREHNLQVYFYYPEFNSESELYDQNEYDDETPNNAPNNNVPDNTNGEASNNDPNNTNGEVPNNDAPNDNANS